ncbi:MAG TPA: hypothetical protein VK183_01600 [Flavobacterium sp.]|nr:hypothetical protein [Flavobacterium sp.]
MAVLIPLSVCCADLTSQEMAAKDYFPLFSSSVVIALFIVDRILVRFNRKKENDRNWFFKVHLEPNLTRINEFFLKVEENTLTSAGVLKTFNSSDLSSFLSVLTHEISIFKSEKRKFELEVLAPLRARYPKESGTLYRDVQDLEDTITSFLDSLDYSEDAVNDMVNSIYQTKAVLLENLYQPTK